MPGDHDFLGPGLGEDAQQSEFEGQGIGVLPGAFHRGVDAADEGRDDLVPARVVPAHLFSHVLSEHVESDSDVPLEFRRPENGRDRSRRLPPPHLELEQAVLGGAVALNEEQVFLAVGVDVVEPQRSVRTSAGAPRPFTWRVSSCAAAVAARRLPTASNRGMRRERRLMDGLLGLATREARWRGPDDTGATEFPRRIDSIR